jgi:endonuclease
LSSDNNTLAAGGFSAYAIFITARFLPAGMDIDIAALNDAFQNKKPVIIVCSCSVHYSGRAESYLAEGDRIIIVKSDGTLLVHQPNGSNPVNYMKNASVHINFHDGKHVLTSQAEKEFLDITITKLHSANIFELEDNASIELVGSERDMSQMIFNNPALIEPGFKPLSTEEHTKYGFIDVFGYDKSNTLVVIECKRYTADLKAVDQLERYVRKIKQLKGLAHVRGIIASPKISPNALHMLQDHKFEWRSISPPNFFERDGKSQKRLGEY